MPDRSDKVLRKQEEAEGYELPYISKSRVEQWLKNPEHFRLKYLDGIREPETEPMVRGTRIHESFEYFYEQIQDDYEDRDRITPLTGDEMAARLPPERKKWSDFIEPYISNFFLWEIERYMEIDDVLDYRPIAIEEERWRDDILHEDCPELMGLADAVLPAASIAEVDSDDGVVIVDFKTGSVPDKKYRSPGIYTELAYYTMLFEDKYEVAGSMAYYPRSSETVVNPDDGSHRDKVHTAIDEMIQASRRYDGSQKFEAKEGPLCGWSPDEGDRSALYGICSQCTWNVPVDNRNQFETLVEEGYADHEIAEHLGCTTNACGYWRYKLDLQ